MAVKKTEEIDISVGNGTELTDSQKKISEICDGLKDLLLYKNERYGDAALHPRNTFFKGDSQNSIMIRLDDKLNRIQNSKEEIRENDCADLAGYLVLLMVSKGMDKDSFKKFKD